MRSTAAIAVFASLSSIGLTLATPLGQMSKRQDPAWSFTVYQSLQRCTGAADPYSGDGSQGCTNGIRNGSFGSFIVGSIREGCSVAFYDEADCAPDSIVAVLTSETEQSCMQGALEAANIPAFDVQCDWKRWVVDTWRGHIWRRRFRTSLSQHDNLELVAFDIKYLLGVRVNDGMSVVLHLIVCQYFTLNLYLRLQSSCLYWQLLFFANLVIAGRSMWQRHILWS